jgi:hypothetical protein
VVDLSIYSLFLLCPHFILIDRHFVSISLMDLSTLQARTLNHIRPSIYPGWPLLFQNFISRTELRLIRPSSRRTHAQTIYVTANVLPQMLAYEKKSNMPSRYETIQSDPEDASPHPHSGLNRHPRSLFVSSIFYIPISYAISIAYFISHTITIPLLHYFISPLPIFFAPFC